MHIAEYFKFVHEAFVKITATKKTEKSQTTMDAKKRRLLQGTAKTYLKHGCSFDFYDAYC